MPRINRFSDLARVFLPNEPGYQSPIDFASTVLLTQDWTGGGLATINPAQMYKRLTTGALAAGGNQVTVGTVPASECWRVVGLGIEVVGLANGARIIAGAYDANATIFCPLSEGLTHVAGVTFEPLPPFGAAIIPAGASIQVYVTGAALNDSFYLTMLVIPNANGQGFTF